MFLMPYKVLEGPGKPLGVSCNHEGFRNGTRTDLGAYLYYFVMGYSAYLQNK